MPGDHTFMTGAANALVAAGYYPWRPTVDEIRVDPVSYFPLKGGLIRWDGTSRPLRRRGLQEFMKQLAKAKAPRRRLSQAPQPTLQFALDDDPLANSPLPTDELAFVASLRGVATVPDPTTHADRPHARKPGGADPSPGFDLQLSRLGSGLARSLRDLAEHGVISYERIGGEMWVRRDQAVHYTCDDQIWED
jgi:hypothetical protein